MQTVIALYVEFPQEIKGQVFSAVRFYNGQYQIFIDKDLSETDRILSLRHELGHIMLGHFQQVGMTMKEMEEEADEFAEHTSGLKLSEHSALQPVWHRISS